MAAGNSNSRNIIIKNSQTQRIYANKESELKNNKMFNPKTKIRKPQYHEQYSEKKASRTINKHD